jgi:flagellar hook-associated protein 1 FlgK
MIAGDDQDGNDGTPMFVVGDPATDMTLGFTDPRLIAAAARNAGPRDAVNLAALQSARTQSRVEDAGTAIIAGVAAAIESRNVVAAAQGAIRDAAIGARDAVTGVNLDAEAVDLIRFQQAYQASSRVIQVARETIQTLLDIR